MRIDFLSVFLLCSFCQAFPKSSDSDKETVAKSLTGAFKKCCEKLHLAGEDSIFKNFYVRTGEDYKPPVPKGRHCCPMKRPHDTHQNLGTAAQDINLKIAAFQLGQAMGEHENSVSDTGGGIGAGFADGTANGNIGAGFADGVGGGGIGAGLADTNISTSTDCGNCGTDVASCIGQFGEALAKTMDVLCCQVLCCCCNSECGGCSGECVCPDNC